MNEAYEQCFWEQKETAFDFELSEQKIAEFQDHLNKCIDLAKMDEVRISDKRNLEVKEGRSNKYIGATKELDEITKDGSDDVHTTLKACTDDLRNIEKIQREQAHKFEKSSRMFERFANIMDEKLITNKEPR